MASKHFVEAVAPASPTAIRKKIKAALQQAKQSGDLGLDSFDVELADLGIDGWENGNGGDEEDGDVTDEGFTAGDALGKALALVRQVCQSTIIALYNIFTCLS